MWPPFEMHHQKLCEIHNRFYLSNKFFDCSKLSCAAKIVRALFEKRCIVGKLEAVVRPQKFYIERYLSAVFHE